MTPLNHKITLEGARKFQVPQWWRIRRRCGVNKTPRIAMRARIRARVIVDE